MCKVDSDCVTVDQVFVPLGPCQLVMVWCFNGFGSVAIMSLETFKYGTFHLSHIQLLLFTSCAGVCINQVTALASDVTFDLVCLTCDCTC